MRNIFSITIICLSFLIVGVFLSLSNNLQHTAAELNRNLAVVFFLDRGLPDGERNALEQKIKASPFITGAVYISPEEALERFRKNFPELRDIVASLKANPFPPSFEATLRDQATRSGQIQEFLRCMAGEKGVEDIQFNRDWVDKMQSLSRMVRAIGFFLGGILVSASFFIISNVIRLNVLARKDEILILRLVGATNNFIRVPFLMEGTILGILGNLLSLLLIFFLIKLFPLYLGKSLGALQQIIAFRYLTTSQCLQLVAGGALIGFLGSLSSLSRFLKI